MLWTPNSGRQTVITNDGIVGTNAPGSAVTTGASSSTKGTAVELISAANNTQDSWGIAVMAWGLGASAVASEGAMDILIGGATDDVLIPDLLVGYCGGASVVSAPKAWFFPVHVPAGLRIAAQAASVRTSAAFRVSVRLFGGQPPPFRVGRKVTTYGMGTVPNGTSITPTASGGAASETQITSSTSEDHFALLPSFQPATDTTITPIGAVNVGIGVGSATADRVGTWWFQKDTNEQMSGPWFPMPAFVNVPSGTRLSMFASNSGANDAAYNGVIHAVS